jgi:hypothetical protein
MTVAEMRQGALDAKWGQRKCDTLEAFLADFFVLHSDNILCSAWAAVRNESVRKGHPISSAMDRGQRARAESTASDKQSKRLPSLGRAPSPFLDYRLTSYPGKGSTVSVPNRASLLQSPHNPAVK